MMPLVVWIVFFLCILVGLVIYLTREDQEPCPNETKHWHVRDRCDICVRNQARKDADADRKRRFL